jgi:hypothetical protein
LRGVSLAGRWQYPRGLIEPRAPDVLTGAPPGGLLVNGATARAANTHAARGPALPPPSS